MNTVYGRTNVCPYTDKCSSWRAIASSERWMEKALIKMRRAGLEKLPKGDGGYSVHSLESKLGHLRKVKKRCYGYNGRCLRFWQFENSKEEKSSNHLYRCTKPQTMVSIARSVNLDEK